MDTILLPANDDIKELFANEVQSLGGQVSEVFEAGECLFCRAVLARSAPVKRGDSLNAGIALRTLDDEILVHPYTFRQVCKNGAIIAHAIQTRRVVRASSFATSDDVAEIISELCKAIRFCASDDAFTHPVDEMRSTTEVQADVALQLMPHLNRLPQRQAVELLGLITRQFHVGRDRTLFGLMNAITAVARETRDPETRWRLEELGGGMPARLVTSPKPAPGHQELVTV